MARRVFVKICGITRLEDARAGRRGRRRRRGLRLLAARARGAWTSRPARAHRRALPPLVVRAWASSWTPTPDDDRRASPTRRASTCVQLHGDEPPELLPPRCRGAVLKAVRVGPGSTPDAAAALRKGRRLLLDTRRRGLPGGTGRTFDWSLARGLRDERAVPGAGRRPRRRRTWPRRSARCGPTRVDVSSGVESRPGARTRPQVRALHRGGRGAHAR